MASESIAKQAGYKAYFSDEPQRYWGGSNYYWIARVTLVGKKDGKYVPIKSFEYGYRFSHNKIKVIDLHVIRSSIPPVYLMPSPTIITIPNSLYK